MPLPTDVDEALSVYMRRAASGTEPPGVGAAVLVAWLVRVNPRRHRRSGFHRRRAESFDLRVVADDTFVIRPIQAKLGPLSAEEFDLG